MSSHHHHPAGAAPLEDTHGLEERLVGGRFAALERRIAVLRHRNGLRDLGACLDLVAKTSVTSADVEAHRRDTAAAAAKAAATAAAVAAMAARPLVADSGGADAGDEGLPRESGVARAEGDVVARVGLEEG